MINYTQEQERIFNVCCGMAINEVASITAPAGSGKTSTLIGLSNKLKDKKILYLAYNKSIAQESKRKFPKNVFVTTIHSLAYQSMNIQNDMLKDKDFVPIEISEYFNCELEIADSALKILNAFLNSSFKNFNQSMVEKRLDVKIACEIWNLMCNRKIKITHSAYLKEYQVSKSKNLNLYDYILLDEAQDSNPVTLDIFLSFNASKILVGDPHQSIYSFRGSVNAMNEVNSDYRLFLTNCFRCSEEIVEKANNVLSTLKENCVPMISRASFPENFKIKTRAIITRTNSKIIELLSNCFEDKNLNYTILRSPESIFKTAIAINFFLRGEKEKIKDFDYLLKFKNKKELVEYIKKTSDVELESSFRIAQRYGNGLFYMKNFANELYKKRKNNSSTIYLVTAHTSKGLEFDSVELKEDFPDIMKMINEGKKTKAEINEEINLYYVAITRAKFELIDNTRNEYFNSIF